MILQERISPMHMMLPCRTSIMYSMNHLELFHLASRSMNYATFFAFPKLECRMIFNKLDGEATSSITSLCELLLLKMFQ